MYECTILLKDQGNVIHDNAHHPCHCKLVQDDEKGLFRASELSVHRCDGSGTRHVEQAEDHQRKAVGRSEAQRRKGGYHGVHAGGGSDILDAEQYAAA